MNETQHDEQTQTKHWKYICQTATYPGYYGLGQDVGEAMRNCRKQPGAKMNRYVVYRLPEKAVNPYCDQFSGAVSWTWEDGYDGPRQVTLEIVASRGVKK